MVKQKKELEIYLPDTESSVEIPVSPNLMPAGFPSPAEEYYEGTIDLNRELIRNPPSTFFAYVGGDSMQGRCIDQGDMLIVDKSLRPEDGDTVIAFIDGEFTMKELSMKEGKVFLVAANDKYKPIEITEENQFIVWGVVTRVVKDMLKHRR